MRFSNTGDATMQQQKIQMVVSYCCLYRCSGSATGFTEAGIRHTGSQLNIVAVTVEFLNMHSIVDTNICFCWIYIGTFPL